MRIAKLLVGSGFAVTLATTVAVPLTRRFTRVEVHGDSMRPTLEPGDRLVVRRTRRPRRGHVVALHDPREPARVLVKRVAALDDDGVVVAGDNPAASTDSRTFGPVAPAHLIGVAIYRYAPSNRATGLHRRPVPSDEWLPTASTPSSPPTTSKS